MDIAGIQKFTLIDYPGKIACTLFTPSCNFRCVYCHNPDLVFKKRENLNKGEIIDFLKKRYGFLDGVVITGGEPTIHEDLPSFISKIKSIGYSVKLDTNGTNPKMIKELFSKKLLDFVAMDIKAPIDEYKNVVGVDVNKEDLIESIKILMSSKVEHVFRTTVWPKLKEEDYEKIGEMLRGAKLYHLQQYSNGVTLDPCAVNTLPLSRARLEDLSKIMKKYVSKVELINI